MKLGDAKNWCRTSPSGSLSPIWRLVEAIPKVGLSKFTAPKLLVTTRSSRSRWNSKQGGQAAFIDAEHALDPAYAKIGVDVDNLLISQPDNGEQALEICETLVRSGASTIVATPSLLSFHRLKSTAIWVTVKWVFRPVSCLKPCANSLVLLVKLNAPSSYQPNSHENRCDVWQPETTTGGNVLKFYSSVR